MKSLYTFLILGAVSAQASLVQFDLSPAGTSPGVGLSPANEVPAVTNSTGSGNAVASGIVFDTEARELKFAIGYGSILGFTDLTGVPTAMHVHGPAGVGTNAAPVFSLEPDNFPATDPKTGGVIVGSKVLDQAQANDLMAGLDYVNIHTALNPGGEIRGQLIPLVTANSAPSLSCPTNSTVECGHSAEVTVVVSDADGDALTVIWSLNGSGVQTNTLPAGQPGAAANVSFSGSLPLGTNTVGVMVTDSATNTTSCSTTVTVVDTTPPVIATLVANPSILWPPNHKMVTVRLRARVTDACSSTTWKIVSVASSEAANAKGSGKTAPDWQIVDDHTVMLRAERAGTGTGRVYTITVQAQDAAGNLSATKAVRVRVPHNMGF